MKEKFSREAITASFRTKSFKAGGYSVAVSLIVIVIVLLTNLAVGKLPSSVTQKDLSNSNLFTLSEQTTALGESLAEPVTIYWIVTEASEDSYLTQLLPLYEELNPNLSVEKIDPVIYPNFAAQFTDETIEQNSLIVVSESRSCYVSHSSLYLYDYTSYYTNGTYNVQFAGETEITRALDYVTTQDLSKVYIVTGHGEVSLPSTFAAGLRTLNLETEALNLQNVSAVPEDADCLLICNPAADLTAAEKDVLMDYLQNGGSLMLLTDSETEGSWTNLMAVTGQYGLSGQKGIVVEGDSSHCLANYPHYIMPVMEPHAITTPILEANLAVITPYAGTITIGSVPDGVTVSSLLRTSDDAFAKGEGMMASTMEQEAGDVDGPFTLAVAVKEETSGAQMVWCSSTMLLDEETNLISSGANLDFFLNAMAWMCGHESAISIHPKQLDTNTLMLTADVAAKLSLLLCIAVPAVFLIAGMIVSVRRRKQ